MCLCTMGSTESQAVCLSVTGTKIRLHGLENNSYIEKTFKFKNAILEIAFWARPI